MESIIYKNFVFKTKLEQFKEQFPLIFDEIYQMGYNEAVDTQMRNYQPDYLDTDGDDYESHYYRDHNHPDAIPTDESERFSLSNSWEIINNKAIELVSCGYTAGNRDWIQFMEGYREKGYTMYIAWNQIHKQFAVESDRSVINQNYPHLVNAVSCDEYDV